MQGPLRSSSVAPVKNFMVLPEGGIVTFSVAPAGGRVRSRKTQVAVFFGGHSSLSVSALMVVRSGVGPAVLGLGLGPALQAQSDAAAAFQAHAAFRQHG